MSQYREIKFTDSDIVNPSDWIPAGEYNPHTVHPFLLHDHGFVICIVFANCLQDAFDIAADEGKLDRYNVTPDAYADYGGEHAAWEQLPSLGGHGGLFDIESLGVEELPNPPFSWCAVWDASQNKAKV